MANWKHISLFVCSILPIIGLAQPSINQLGYLDIPAAHGEDLNDIWGYVDGSGNEYALIGAENGVSVVDVSDPNNPTEVFWKTGMNSVWRDLKTYNGYCYVTTEAQEGLLILDLNGLPNASLIDSAHFFGNGWLSAHNLYIDEFGYMYIFGANRGNGGAIIYDLNVDPWNPVEVGDFDDYYIHDGYARNNKLYSGHIFNGFFSVVDVSNKSNPVLLGTHATPNAFSHNVWLSDDGLTAFTTDELEGSYLASFDVSDPANIVELDKIQSTPEVGTIPHNTHVLNDYLITSWYTDGVLIHDAANPSNIVEIASFDSSPFTDATYEGNWGAYPFLPSGNLLISDRQEGLFVLGVNYQRACYIEGTITDVNTTFAIPNAKAQIISDSHIENSDLNGFYETGIALPGTYDIAYDKYGYFPDTLFGVVAQTANVTTADIALQPKAAFSLAIIVKDQNGNPIEDAVVELKSIYITHNLMSNASGIAAQSGAYEDYYNLTVGKWGYGNFCQDSIYFEPSNNSMTVTLTEGYYDDFALDLGWTITGDASTGMWERGEPIGTSNGNSNPEFDSPFGCRDLAMITGNGGNGADFDDIDYGYTQMESPSFDVSAMSDPHVNYFKWFYCKYGPYPEDDSLLIYLSDGSSKVLIDSMTFASNNQSEWLDTSIRILDHMGITNPLSLIVYAADLDTFINITEAAFDHFYISEGNAQGTIEPLVRNVDLYPNPNQGIFTLSSNLNIGRLDVYAIDGRLIESREINTKQEELDLQHLKAGNYILRFRNTAVPVIIVK
jgi:choice-of-anchor B domain-containing protein